MTITQQLAYQIADECARSDIETYCTPKDIDGKRGYDLSTCDPEDWEWVDRAVGYLALRGLLIQGDKRVVYLNEAGR